MGSKDLGWQNGSSCRNYNLVNAHTASQSTARSSLTRSCKIHAVIPIVRVRITSRKDRDSDGFVGGGSDAWIAEGFVPADFLKCRKEIFRDGRFHNIPQSACTEGLAGHLGSLVLA